MDIIGSSSRRCSALVTNTSGHCHYNHYLHQRRIEHYHRHHHHHQHHHHQHHHHHPGMGIFRLSPEFRLFDGPRGRSRDSSKYWEKVFTCVYVHRELLTCVYVHRELLTCVYVHRELLTCVYVHRELLTPCAPAAIMSAILSRVCPELAGVSRVRAFHGGLRARLWQVKIGLRSFGMRFSQVEHRVARGNSFVLREVHHVNQGLRVCTKQVRQK